ncbi:MAG: hypothetical protein EP312_10250 [Gammaproteobacteria bacterium]|nr:MAG: hypothetical protein EP312_10250 [Gammaproteobacteria bacterium]
MLELLPQCCDAGQYLDAGRICATTGQCWHEYRPGGTIYWFSIPYRMNWPIASLAWMNIGIMLLSCLLAPLALLRDWGSYSLAKGITHYMAVLMLAIIAHGFFFYPVLFNSLADAPGTALALMGAWLLLLARRYESFWLFVLAGAVLGCALWVRAFYLYPILGAMGVYALCWAFQRRRSLKDWGLLAALLPLAMQFYSTHQSTGQWSYLDAANTSSWENVHFKSNFSMYDTILPRSFIFQRPSCIEVNENLELFLQNKDVPGLACLFWARTDFYLGSYASKTYLFNKYERWTSKTFLLLNMTAILFALLWLWRHMAKDMPASAFVFFLTGLSYGQAIVLLPEQRFAMLLQVMAWMLAAMFVRDAIRHKESLS